MSLNTHRQPQPSLKLGLSHPLSHCTLFHCRMMIMRGLSVMRLRMISDGT